VDPLLRKSKATCAGWIKKKKKAAFSMALNSQSHTVKSQQQQLEEKKKARDEAKKFLVTLRSKREPLHRTLPDYKATCFTALLFTPLFLSVICARNVWKPLFFLYCCLTDSIIFFKFQKISSHII
jgi:hypothetical protein